VGQLFDKLVSLYRLVTPDQDGEADVRLSDEATLEAVRYLLSEDRSPDDTGLTIRRGDPDRAVVGDTIRLGFGIPRLGVGYLFRDVDALVRSGQIAEPARYYLWKPARAKDDAGVPEEIVRYRDVLALVALLKESAAYLDESAQELVFVQQGRFNVPVRYALADIGPTVAASGAKLRALFGDQLHREQKLAMLATAIQSTTSGLAPPERFAALLQHLDAVASEVADSYRMFCSNFSYEKIKSDIQDAHIEFTAKIHKTFSDIQSQLLAIPIATVIVATQMKQAVHFGGQFWINTGVLMGSAIFVALFWLLVANQRHTLDVLGEEIERRQAAIAKDHAQVGDLLACTFKKLHSRMRAQRQIICVVLAIVVLGFVATAVVYGFLLPPAVAGINRS
jgi:hypothetical protein